MDVLLGECMGCSSFALFSRNRACRFLFFEGKSSKLNRESAKKTFKILSYDTI